MVDDHRVLASGFVEVFPVKRAVGQLRVVEHEALDPVAGRCRLRLLPDGRYDLSGRAEVAVHAIKLVDAARVTVGVDEAGGHGHAGGIHDPRLPRRDIADVGGAADGNEAAVAHGKGLRPRARAVTRINLRVDHDEVGRGRRRG